MKKNNDIPFGEMDLEQRILSRSSFFTLPEGKSKEEALLDIKKRISATIDTPKKGINRRIYIYRISIAAASIILLLGFWSIFGGRYTEVCSPKGSHVEYKLPDGSRVTLNSDSKISFKKGGFSSNRKIELRGEAFFEVIPGETFAVATNNGIISVMGTSFNVFSREENFSVDCLTGKVKVESNGQSAVISGGESVGFANKQLSTSTRSYIENPINWIEGEFYFENAPLNLVLDEIERQFNFNFAPLDVEDKYFTGSFSNKDINAALDIVCSPLGLDYEIGANMEIRIMEMQ